MPKGNKRRLFLKLLGRLEDVWLMQKLQQDLILIRFFPFQLLKILCVTNVKKSPRKLILFEVLFV